MEQEYIENSFVLHYTNHANVRSRQRKVHLDIAATRRLEAAVQAAKTRKLGPRVAFFVDKLIFIIDVRMNEVITVMDEYKIAGTNVGIRDINGAMIVNT